MSDVVRRLASARIYGAKHGFDWAGVPDDELAGELGPAFFQEDHGVVAAAIFQGLVVEPPAEGEASTR